MSATKSLSPGQRAWLRFKRNRRGVLSLWIFSVAFVISLFAEVISNDRPLIVLYQGETYFPLLQNYPEKTFGGDFETPTDFLDPFIERSIREGSNWAIYPLNRYSFTSLNYFAPSPNPAPPSAVNWLGTDDRGRDVFARLLYGFRTSVLFALALTAIGVVLGIVMGAIQGLSLIHI